jgi:hypothetical protein
MANGRVLASVAALLALAGGLRAQTYPLAEAAQPGDCCQITLRMDLSGELRIHKADGVTPIKLEANSVHSFAERVLAVGGNGLPEKAARIYDKDKVSIKVGADATEHSLRPERRLIVAQRYKEQPLVYCPAGALQRGELDVAGEHFDTLALAGLLPGKAVAVGDTWKVANGVAQALCAFDGLTEQSLEGKLVAVDAAAQTAQLTVSGTAGGIDQGAMAKLTITATGRFDLKAKRLVELEWKQSDERDQGPVSPASKVQATTTLRRRPTERPAALSDVALVSVPADDKVPEAMTRLEYRDPQDRYTLLYARQWQLTAQTKNHVVLRLMERGDFVAQATLTPWEAAEKGKHLTAEEFKAAMERTPGWEPDKELQSGEVTVGEGLWGYRLSMLGKLDNVEVLQNFYLLAAPGGEQLVATFTLTPKQADKLGARDLALVGGLALPAPKK